MTIRESLETILLQRVKTEQESMRQKIQKATPEEIQYGAYAIYVQQTVSQLFDDMQTFTLPQLEALAGIEKPLQALSQQWMDFENSNNNDKPIFMQEKLFAFLEDWDKLEQWVSFEKNLMCKEAFEAGIHACDDFCEYVAFLEKWKREYGTDRCFYVLGFTAKDDPEPFELDEGAARKIQATEYPEKEKAEAYRLNLVEIEPLFIGMALNDIHNEEQGEG